MKKSSFVAMVLGTVSGVLFSLGMCMALLEEWNAFTEGVIFGVCGTVLTMVTAIPLPSTAVLSLTITAITLGLHHSTNTAIRLRRSVSRFTKAITEKRSYCNWQTARRYVYR